MMHTPRTRAVTTVIVTLALAAGLGLAGCGAKKAEPEPLPVETKPQQKASPTSSQAGGGKVLEVIANTEFEPTEYKAVRSACENAGYQVVVANSSGKPSVSADGVTVPPDTTIADAKEADYAAVVLIGGPGVNEYYNNAKLQSIVRDAAAAGKVVGAICIAPVVLANAGVLNGKKGTVWPDEKERLAAAGCAVQGEQVVVDGKIVTAEGPDVAVEFADAVVKNIKGQ